MNKMNKFATKKEKKNLEYTRHWTSQIRVIVTFKGGTGD